MAPTSKSPSLDDADRPDDVGESDRVLRSLKGAALALAAGATLGGAAMLEPDARGYGTHEQLGIFDSCAAVRGECPSCGLVTSVVHGVRGNVGESLKTHGGGMPIVLALAWAFVIGVAELLPRPWPSMRAKRAVGIGLALAISVGLLVTVALRLAGAS